MNNTEKLVDFLIRYRLWLLITCFGLVAIAVIPSTGLQFERSIENLFSKDDPRYENYRLDKKLFGGIETAILAYDDPDLFSVNGLTRLVALQKKLEQVEGVNKVTCLNDIRRPSAALESRTMLEQLEQKAITAAELKSEILATDLYRERLVSADGKTVLLLLELAPKGDDPLMRSRTISGMRQIAEEHQPPVVVMGGPVLVEEIFATLDSDGVLLGVASSLILTLVIAILFRSIRWTLLPLIVVQVALIWTKAIVAFSGLKLSMVSAQLVAMVTVIGVATSVHLMVRYREERSTHPAEEAIRRTLTHIIPAIFWTCLTTAAGFAALYASSVTPFQTYAVMMALGSMLVFFAAIMLVPAAALLFQSFDTRLGQFPAEKSFVGVLESIVQMLKKNPWRVVTLVTMLIVVCSLGASRLTVATDFTNNFRKSSNIVRSYLFLKERLASLDTMDVLIDIPKTSSQDFDETVKKMRALQSELESDDRVVDTISFVDLLDFLKIAEESIELAGNAGLPEWFPPLDKISDGNRLVLLGSLQPALTRGFLNLDANTARMIVQLKPIMGSGGKTEVIEHVENVSQSHFENSKVAGFYVLMASVVRSLLGDQWLTFALSVIAIFLMMSVAFRSVSLGLAALIPNAAPIFIVLGFMGWFGLKINMATAMMASVSMGLSVDFSIHYLYRFRQELKSDKTFYEAMTEAHSTVGPAMIAANLALIAGFLCLTLSSLIPSVHFGLMVSVTMLGGLIGNLVVLPLLLQLLWKSGLIKAK